MEYKDYDALNKRYVFPGNIKVPVEIIERLSNKEKDNLTITLNSLRSNLISCVESGEDTCFKITLTKTTSLYIDFRNNNLNFYIEDDKNEFYTQILSLADCEAIERKETGIIKAFKAYNEMPELTDEKRRNNLTQTLVHSAYESKRHNKGSPTVFGKKVSDDFSIDRYEEE